ncbi:hypothetical protein LCGC14_1006950 [marine sediment metagenome]|uniref:Zinc finger CHC2-type domain-containing protein n=1 Tax=marine sediment metagenome TaxID=412755 RepID=A0A0F9QJQ6_9ZZZZ
MLLSEIYQYIIAHIQDGAYTLSGKELFVPCPECGNESHFSINLTNGKYNCFKCPVGGKLAPEIVKHRLEWQRLVRNLPTGDFLNSKLTGKIILPENSFIIYNVLYLNSLTSKKKHIQNSLSLCEKAFKYCIKRKLTKEQIRDYRVYVCPMDPRVYFPYWDDHGEIVYYMGRKMMGDQDTLKTKDAENAEKPLFGRHVKVHRDTVVLVEGAFDHFVTPISYAIMGSSISVYQMLLLKEDGVKRVFVLGDPDASATIVNTTKKLRDFRITAFPVFIHMDGDPSDLGRKRMEMITKELLSKDRTVYQPIHISTVCV